MQLETNLTRYPKATPYVSQEDKTCSYVHTSSAQIEVAVNGQQTARANDVNFCNILLVIVLLCTTGMSPYLW